VTSKREQPKGLVAKIVTVITVGYCLYTLLYIGHVFERFGIYINVVSYRALFLAFLMTLTFLTIPAGGGKRGKLPWYDLLFLVLGIAGPLFIFAGYERLAATRYALGEIYPFEVVLAVFTVVATLEITRRVVGMAMPIISIMFLVHMWFGNYLPGDFYINQPAFSDVVHFMVYSSEGIFGTVLGVASTLIIMFVIFSQFLQVTPLGKFFINISLALLGHVRGGPAKVAVVASSFFGTLSGSANANVAATGTFTIPMMKSIGYKPEFAGAVEAVASSGGQIMPPIMGVTAFIMADWLRIPYWSVCVAALIPAILYYLAVFIAVDAEAVKNGLKGVPRDQCPSAMKTLQEGWPVLIPLAVLVLLLAVYRYDAATAALYAMLTLIAISMIPKKTRLKPAHFVEAFRSSGSATLTAGNACACAGIMIGALMISQFGIRLSDLIVKLSGGNLLLLLVLAGALTYLFGMGMASVPAYIMVVVLVAPALIKLGVPGLAAHMFVFYWIVIHFYTPPVCTAVYTACGISGGRAMSTAFTSMRISIASYIVAFMMVYRQELLTIKGSVLEIIAVFLVCAIGIAFVAWGLAGFVLDRKVNAWQRALLISGGTILFLPYLASNIVGLALGGSVFVWTRIAPRLAARKAEKGEYQM